MSTAVRSWSWARLVGSNLALALTYVALGRLGLSLAHVQDNATLIWAPTGIALAALVLWGPRLAPGVAIGALTVNLLVGTPVLVAIGITLGNTLEAVVGAALLLRLGLRPALSRLSDVVLLLTVGAVGCTVVSAAIGVASLTAAGLVTPHQLPSVALVWWLGDAGGAVVVAPLVLVGLRGTPRFSELWWRLETWFALGAAVTAAVAAFGGIARGPTAMVLAFLPFPFLVWAGLRLGPRGAVVGSTAVSVVAVLGTALGQGPFVGPSLDASLMVLWAYAATVGATALTLAAAVAERDLAETERRKSVAERLAVERRMQQAQRLESLGVLAGGIAHDFNNLLMAIRLNSEMLRLEAESDERICAMAEDIEIATDRAADLCTQLLSYAGRRPLEKKPLSWGALLADLDKLVAASVPKKVHLIFDVPEDLPSIRGDRGQLSQVLMNLVINAAEAYGDRAGEVRVEAGAVELSDEELAGMVHGEEAAPGTYVFVEVRDEAGGMSPETQGRIFDPFFTTKFQGRGLGLAAVLGIVGAHRGALDVDSAVGGGTTFRVFMPAEPAAVAIDEARGRSSRQSKITVLVADDEPSVLRVAVGALRSAGHEVIEATDGQQAVARFEEHAARVDVVLLDLMMPRLGGVEALEEIREMSPEVGCVLMSGYADVGVDVAVDSFLGKPFGVVDLLHHVAAAERAGAARRRLAHQLAG